ncbi:MAG: HDOD domain-containing protein [Chromatiales bacterium]|nr:HDOD domain-containing protein [Chromatiales bacterium]
MILNENGTSKLISGIAIPPAPFILTQLHHELQKEDPVFTDIADTISQDIGMSALVLRTVNSSFFGLRVKVNSIQHAVNLLGIQYTVNIITGLLLRRTFDESEGANPPNYWDSPVNIAMTATNIARTISCGEPDEMYMLGLFHNAGHALLSHHFADYKEFYENSINREDLCITEIENQQYNTDHAVLGYYLARSWGIDRHIAEVIRDHHIAIERLTEKDGAITPAGNMLAILKIAEHVDKSFWGIKPDNEWTKVEDVVLDYLGISKPDFEDLREDMLDKLIAG